jgi:hypothetical protein
MAKTYHRHLGTRLINWWFRTLTRLGLGASYRYILTVPGRKSGQLPGSPDEAIAAELPRHAVFRLIPGEVNHLESE